MCVFTDRGSWVDVGAGYGLTGYRVMALGEEPGYFASPMRDAVWHGIPQKDGSWLIDGPTGARELGGEHMPVPGGAQGFYIVDDPFGVQGSGTLLRVRPAGACVRHESPGGWRASSLVVESAGGEVAPAWLAGEVEALRERDPHGDGARLALTLERAVPKQSAQAPAWLRSDARVMPAGVLVDAVRRWIRDAGLFGRSTLGYGTWHARTVLVADDDPDVSAVNDFLGRPRDRDAPRLLANYVSDEVASRLMVGSARLVLASVFELDVQRVREMAGPVLKRLGATVLDVVPPHESRDGAWLLETCRAAEEKYRRETNAARKQRREAERFGRQLVTMLRRDPRGAVAWLREQPAPVRKREGIVRPQDAGSVRFRLEGESWTLARFEPDVARLELVARGRSVDVSARWADGRWHPAGARHSDVTSSGWGNVYHGRRADTLARILGQRWRLVHLTYEEAGNRYGDTRAHLTERDARAIERARAASLKRVRAIVG